MGGKKKTTIGYKYYMGIHSGICRGPVNALVEWKAGDKTAWRGNATANQSIRVSQPGLFGGDKKEGGIDGTLEVMMGGPAQVAPATLAGMLGADVPGFRGVLTLFYDGLVSAMNPYIKPWKFRVRRSTAGWDGGAWYPEKAMIPLAGGEIHAMNPVHIIYECLTNREWSRGVSRSRFADAIWRAAADQVYTEGFGLCLRWQRRSSVRSFLQTVVDHISAEVYQSRFDGLFHIRLVRDDYDADTLPLFDEDSGLLSIEEDDAGTVAGAVNEIIVRWRDPITDEVRMFRERNLAAIHAQGGQVISETIEFPGIPTAQLAGRVAVRELRSRSGYLRRFKVKLDRRGFRLEPGAPFRIRDTRRGIDNMVVRAGRIEDGTLTDGAITIVAVQDVFGLPATSMSAAQPPGWQPPDNTPYAVATRRLFEATWRDLAEMIDPANLQLVGQEEARLMALAVKPTSLSMGFVMESRVGSGAWDDTDDGSFCPSGLTVTALSRTDTSVVLVSGSDLDFVTPGGVALLGDELVRIDAWNVSTATATIARGCVDTVPAEHAAGTRLYFFPDNPAFDETTYSSGLTVQARLLTQTSAGTLPQASAPIDSLPLMGRQGRPYPPGRLRINGLAYPATVTGDVTISWSHRDRLLQADQIVDTSMTSIGPEPGTTYRVRIYSGATLKRTYSGITGTSQIYSGTDESADGGPFNPLRIVIDAVRDGLYSNQVHDIEVKRGDLPPTGGRRAWRIKMTANNGSPDWFSLNELQMRSAAGGANLCSGGTSFANQEYSGWGANRAFDGVLVAPGWSSTSAASPAYLGYMFPTHVTVNVITIYSRSVTSSLDQIPRDFTVQSSDDTTNGADGTWADEWSISGQTGWALNESRTFHRP